MAISTRTLHELARLEGWAAERAELPPVPDEAAGAEERFEKFLLVRSIGRGGMGEVWKAWQIDLGRWVALKFIRGGSPEDVARFIREARNAASLAHPSIVAVYEAGERGGRHYIAMEYIEGGDLHTLRPTSRRAVEMIRDAALAVHSAHERGIVHRDLKPANLLVSRDGRVYVGDFGLSRAVDAPSGISATGLILGTPNYMAPEQARGDPADARTDVYGLGATLYEAVGGGVPFEGEALLDVLRSVVDDEPKPPPNADRELRTIIFKCMEKEPAKRYASAAALAADLDRYLNDEPLLAHPPSVLYRLQKRMRRQPALWALGALLALCAAAGLYFLVKSREAYRLRSETEAAARAAAERQELVERSMRRLRQAEDELSRTMTNERLTAVYADLEALAEELAAAGQWTLRGEAHMLLNRDERAVEDFTRALDDAATPPAFRARAALGRARACLRALQDFAITGNADDPTPRDAEAQALIRRIDADLALAGRDADSASMRDLIDVWTAFADEDLKQAREMALDRIKLGGRTEELWFVLALAPLNPEETVRSCTESLDRYRGQARVWFHRGLARHHLRDRAGAIDDYTEALRLRPTYYEAYTNRGHLRSLGGDDVGALADYEAALRLQPHRAGTYVNRGALHQERGRIELAEADYRRAIELEPDSPLAYANLAMLCRARGEPDAAMEWMERAIGVDPDYARGYGYRGLLHLDRGDRDAALADYDRAVAGEPRAADLRTNRATILDQLGRRAEAVAEFTEAIRLDGRLTQAYAGRGYARWAAGDPSGALADFEKFIELAPGAPQAETIRREIEMLRRQLEGDF